MPNLCDGGERVDSLISVRSHSLTHRSGPREENEVCSEGQREPYVLLRKEEIVWVDEGSAGVPAQRDALGVGYLQT